MLEVLFIARNILNEKLTLKIGYDVNVKTNVNFTMLILLCCLTKTCRDNPTVQ